MMFKRILLAIVLSYSSLLSFAQDEKSIDQPISASSLPLYADKNGFFQKIEDIYSRIGHSSPFSEIGSVICIGFRQWDNIWDGRITTSITVGHLDSPLFALNNHSRRYFGFALYNDQVILLYEELRERHRKDMMLDEYVIPKGIDNTEENNLRQTLLYDQVGFPVKGPKVSISFVDRGRDWIIERVATYPYPFFDNMYYIEKEWPCEKETEQTFMATIDDYQFKDDALLEKIADLAGSLLQGYTLSNPFHSDANEKDYIDVYCIDNTDNVYLVWAPSERPYRVASTDSIHSIAGVAEYKGCQYIIHGVASEMVFRSTDHQRNVRIRLDNGNYGNDDRWFPIVTELNSDGEFSIVSFPY